MAGRRLRLSRVVAVLEEVPDTLAMVEEGACLAHHLARRGRSARLDALAQKALQQQDCAIRVDGLAGVEQVDALCHTLLQGFDPRNHTKCNSLTCDEYKYKFVTSTNTTVQNRLDRLRIRLDRACEFIQLDRP